MLDKQLQVKNSMIYMALAFASNVIPLLALPIFTRVLTTSDYGLFALAQVYAIVVSGIANFGMRIGYERNYFQCCEGVKRAQLLFSTLAFVIAGHVFLGFLTYVFRDAIAVHIFESLGHGRLLFYAFCAVGVTSLNMYYLTYFRNSENAKSYFWYAVCEKLVGVIIALGMVVYLDVGVIGLVWGQLCAGIIVFIMLTTKLVRMMSIEFNWVILRESIKLCYPLTPRIFFGVLGSQIDKYLLGLLATIGGVGIYSIGQKIAYLVFMFMTAIQNVFSPQVYKRMFDMGKDGGASVGKYLTPFLYVSILVALLVALFSEDVITLFMPASYHGAIDVVIVLSMLYSSMFFGKQPQLIYKKKTYMTSLLTLANIALSIGINIPFIMRWGTMGAAWGALCAGLISGAAYFLVSQHYYKIRWEYGKVTQIFGIYFVAAMSMVMMRHYLVGYDIRLITKGLFLASYLYLGIRMRVIATENYRLIKNALVLRSATTT